MRRRIYVTGKTEGADEVGITRNTTIRKPADISEEELLKIIDDLNADDTVDGITISCRCQETYRFG